MKKFLVLLFLLLTGTFPFACTTFFINKKGQKVFGRNYDWVTGSGMMMINERGAKKASVKGLPGKRAYWMSLYGSVTFNQFGKEFPNGGMNEEGLVVELMWLQGTAYPARDDRPAVSVLQWIQYQLDCHRTIEEVIQSDAFIRISNEENIPLHYLVADAEGNAATIEFLNGKMVVHKGTNLPFAALTNTTYAESLAAFQQKREVVDNSNERFATVCSRLQEIKKTDPKISLIDFSFSLLQAVAQGSFTKWSVVYDLPGKKIFFKTDGHPHQKMISFRDVEFSCKGPVKAVSLNSPLKGNLAPHFTPITFEKNKEVVLKGIEESSTQISVPAALVEEAIQHFKVTSCK